MTEYQDNSSKFEKLRQKYHSFIYEDFTIKEVEEGLKIQFFFSCGEFTFSPYQIFYNKVFFNNLKEQINHSNHFTNLTKEFIKTKKEFRETAFYFDNLKPLVFNLGLIELISYWKAICPAEIIIKCGFLDEKQQQFWKKLWFNGLGEFFYLNNIKTDVEHFVKITCQSDKQYRKQSFELKQEYIVPIGGGKDSVVSLELLRAKGKKITPMVINSRGATEECLKRAGFSDNQTIKVKRIIDKNLLLLNKQGYLNGHTPFSAMLAFTTLIASVLSGKKYIALSNENSASEATDLQTGVNHQYSKSLEFENDFRVYYKEYLCEQIEYFSFLRPISEIKIAQIFSYFNYFDVFKSCNVGSKQDIWCGNCPKCLFAFIILSPFNSPEKINQVFNKNLFEDENLLTYFRELTGLDEIKPFECVGTIKEVNLAISQRIKLFGINENEILLKYWWQSELKDKYYLLDFDKSLNEENNDNNLSEDLKNCFKQSFVLSKKAMLAKKLSTDNIAVMGLGREGVATLKLLNEIFPDKSFIVFDENKEKFLKYKDLLKNHQTFCDKSNLSFINNHSSLIFLTPGIAPKDFMELDFNKLTNQCDIFLQLFANQCIGISGTKGKSTTSSLIYNILQENIGNCILAGNIGIPFFDIIDNINENTNIVLELSCHQLQLIKKSPHISVLLNLYEEHLDHYLSFEDYQLAKMNLLLKGVKEDIFIYNKEDKRIKTWIEKFALQRNYIPFELKDYIYKEAEFLKGNHNKFNILAALNVAKLFAITTETALKSINTFKGLEHRMEFFGKFNSVAYYDDSISTIPQATLAAMKSLSNVSVLILGGMDRGIDYTSLRELKTFTSLKNIVLVGQAGRRIKEILQVEEDNNISRQDMEYFVCDDWTQIVLYCKTKAKENTSVLLSPAASSYDQFRNFAHRGDTFRTLVRRIYK